MTVGEQTKPRHPVRGAWRAAAPAVLAAAWGGNHFSPLLLMYRQVDGYTAVQVDLFFAFYVLGLTPGFLIAGPLSDRHGRRRLVASALALGVIGSVILALGSTSVFWMCAGRLVSGVSVAVAMVAGTSWIKELSQDDAGPALRARRASLTLTAGFGLGAGVSGALAQWGPAPTLLPYAVQIALSLIAAVPLIRAPETRPGSGWGGSAGRIRRSAAAELRDSAVRGLPAAAGGERDLPAAGLWAGVAAGLRVPEAARPRFLRVVVPMAPWVFAAPALAFVISPAVLASRLGTHRVGFAALLAVVALCCGAAVQPVVPRIARRTGGRQSVAGLALIALGTVVLAVAPSVLWTLVTAVLFGLGYGICIVAGLVEVQAMAGPDDLAGLTGIYYSLTYVGFVLPVALAALARVASYRTLLLAVAAIAVCCAAGVAASLRAVPDSVASSTEVAAGPQG